MAFTATGHTPGSTKAKGQRDMLTATGIEKTYFTTEPPAHVLHDIHLSVAAGEFVAIMGASGSGKSTLLYCLSGMDRPTAGRVQLEGQTLTSLNDREMSRVRLTRMGFIFQQPYFLQHLNIRDNVLLPALKAARGGTAAVTARVDGLLQRFDIAHIAHHGVTQVSGGQLQRASICRALAVEPAVLFADEPTGALNSSMTASVMDMMSDVHRDGTTIVMVTHDAACAARAERVIYLRDGHIVGHRNMGAWQPSKARQRTDTLLAWLRKRGF